MANRSRTDFSTYPTDHLVGLIATPEQVPDAVDELARQGGFDEDAVTVLCCEAGRESLDVSGARGGALRRVLRILQRVGVEHQHLGRYADALDAGEVLIAVRSGQSGKLQAARILADHGAHDLHFYARSTVESLPIGLLRPDEGK